MYGPKLQNGDVSTKTGEGRAGIGTPYQQEIHTSTIPAAGQTAWVMCPEHLTDEAAAFLFSAGPCVNLECPKKSTNFQTAVLRVDLHPNLHLSLWLHWMWDGDGVEPCRTIILNSFHPPKFP